VTAPLAPAVAPEIDDVIRAIVTRLSRPTPSGGSVIECAAILAEGADSEAIIRWIIAHDGQPEIAPAALARGLHGTRLSDGAGAERRPPRYVMPAGALT
jgi:hypothetical protein